MALLSTGLAGAELGPLYLRSSLGEVLDALVTVRGDPGEPFTPTVSLEPDQVGWGGGRPRPGEVVVRVDRNREGGGTALRISSLGPVTRTPLEITVRIDSATFSEAVRYVLPIGPPSSRSGTGVIEGRRQFRLDPPAPRQAAGGAATPSGSGPATAPADPLASLIGRQLAQEPRADAPGASSRPPPAAGAAARTEAGAPPIQPALPDHLSSLAIGLPRVAVDRPSMPEPWPDEIEVKPGDNLGQIARRLARPELAPDQIVWALFDANRPAFQGSVHQLLVGARLRVPAIEEVRRLSVADARAALKRDSDAAEAAARARAAPPGGAAPTASASPAAAAPTGATTGATTELRSSSSTVSASTPASTRASVAMAPASVAPVDAPPPPPPLAAQGVAPAPAAASTTLAASATAPAADAPGPAAAQQAPAAPLTQARDTVPTNNPARDSAYSGAATPAVPAATPQPTQTSAPVSASAAADPVDSKPASGTQAMPQAAANGAASPSAALPDSSSAVAPAAPPTRDPMVTVAAPSDAAVPASPVATAVSAPVPSAESTAAKAAAPTPVTADVPAAVSGVSASPGVSPAAVAPLAAADPSAPSPSVLPAPATSAPATSAPATSAPATSAPVSPASIPPASVAAPATAVAAPIDAAPPTSSERAIEQRIRDEVQAAVDKVRREERALAEALEKSLATLGELLKQQAAQSGTPGSPPSVVAANANAQGWQQRLFGPLPPPFDHPFAPFGILIGGVLLLSWIWIRLLPRRRATRESVLTREPPRLRRDPEFDDLLVAPAPPPRLALTGSARRESAPNDPPGLAGGSAQPSSSPVGQSSPLAREPSPLERAIGGRFDLPSLDLDESPAGSEAERAEGDAAILRPTPRGTTQSPSAPMQRDAATNFAVSSGLATVVRQQIDARLELAAAYVDLGDAQRARQLLAQTLIDGDEAQRRTAQSLLNRLAQDR